jgi:single-strand DNA-binding protein
LNNYPEMKETKSRKMNQLRNKVQLIGNLGKDVEFKTLESGQMLARVALATKDVFKNQKGEKVVDTQWHTLVGWGKTAENMNVFLKKGKQVAINGQLKHRSYEDKEGTKKYVSEIWVSEFMLLN